MNFWDYIARPFGILLLWLYNLVGNYGVAVFLFAVVVKLILLPFQMKSKKSMMRMSALNPQLQQLQKRHEGNQRKYQEEVNKLYKEEHVNPMSGCLWSLIPFPILIALYRAIRYPLTVMMGIGSELLAEGGALMTRLSELGVDTFIANHGFSENYMKAYSQLVYSRFISENYDQFSGISDKLVNINYGFLGLNVGDTPKLFFWNAPNFTWSDAAIWLPAIGLFLIPIISAVLSWVNMKLSQATNPAPSTPAPAAQAANTEQQMKTMNLMMPLISVYICFTMPAILGLYWIFTSVLACVQEVILNKIYAKKMAAENAEREKRMRIREAEYERKRQETERLRAEGATVKNTNTSKKKEQARQKAEMDQLKAAAIREERAAKRAAMGIAEPEIPDSQVGNRRYARGRAYVADRFEHPERAAEETAEVLAANEEADRIAAEDEAAVEAALEAEAETAEAVESAEEAAEAADETAEAPAEAPADNEE